MGTFSHFLMVINSSINILFYCIFNAQFRQEGRKALADLAKAMPFTIRHGGGGNGQGSNIKSKVIRPGSGRAKVRGHQPQQPRLQPRPALVAADGGCDLRAAAAVSAQ